MDHMNRILSNINRVHAQKMVPKVGKSLVKGLAVIFYYDPYFNGMKNVQMLNE